MKTLLHLAIACLPWFLKRRILSGLFGYTLHPTAFIGKSVVMAKRVSLGPNARIGHLSLVKGLDELRLGECARLGNLNWVSGFPSGGGAHFSHQPDRKPSLAIGDHAAVTNRHLLDCTNSVAIGAFSTFAGFRSQILTHSIDLAESRQSSAPVVIGDHCFVGTDCVILGGARLPSRSVLGAKSLLNKAHHTEGMLYAGVPAAPIKQLPEGWKYFAREVGFVR